MSARLPAFIRPCASYRRPDMALTLGLSRGLELTAPFASSALILRHSIREAIPAGETGNNIPLTTEGRELARILGASIASRLATITSSPIGRCTETAEHMLQGAHRQMEVPTSRMLGDPGIFIADGQAAWTNFVSIGTTGVMMHLSRSHQSLPGMNNPRTAAYDLLDMMMGKCEVPGLHVFVTHDVILAGAIGQLMKAVETEADLPDFLEGAFFWNDGGKILGSYRNRTAVISARR